MKGFVDDIEELTESNKDYRRVFYTGKNLQLVRPISSVQQGSISRPFDGAAAVVLVRCFSAGKRRQPLPISNVIGVILIILVVLVLMGRL